MLKISIKDSQTKRVLVLEGKLIAPWTNELNKAACQDRTIHAANRELIIDLWGVTDISSDGEEALFCLMVQGAKFRGGGVFVKRVLKQLAQRVRPE
jgi:anti-anti-sigma regulatory factor